MNVLYERNAIDTQKTLPNKMQVRMDALIRLGSRRDQVLNADRMDVVELSALAEEYQAAGFQSCAADLFRRVEYYSKRKVKR